MKLAKRSRRWMECGMVIVCALMIHGSAEAGMIWRNNAVWWQFVPGSEYELRVSNGQVQMNGTQGWSPTNVVTPCQYLAFRDSQSNSPGYSSSNTYEDLLGTQQNGQATTIAGHVLNTVLSYYGIGPADLKDCSDSALCEMALCLWNCGGGSGCGFGCFYKDAEPPERNWELTLSSSTSYLHQDYHVVGLAKPVQDTVGVSLQETVSAVWSRGRFRMNLLVPYMENNYRGDLDALDSRSLAVQAMPQYFLLDQRADGLDLNLLLNAGYAHTWYESLPDLARSESAMLGAGVGVGKTTRYGDLRLGYVYQPTWNISGDTQLTGHANLDTHSFGGRYLVPVAPRTLLELGATYQYVSDLPAVYDADGIEGQAGLKYVEKDWLAGVSFTRSFQNDNLRQWRISLDVVFRW